MLNFDLPSWTLGLYSIKFDWWRLDLFTWPTRKRVYFTKDTVICLAVHHTLFSTSWTMYSVYNTQDNIHTTQYTENSKRYTLHCTLKTVHSKLYPTVYIFWSTLSLPNKGYIVSYSCLKCQSIGFYDLIHGTVQCIVHNVQQTLYRVWCWVSNILCTLYRVI